MTGLQSLQLNGIDADAWLRGLKSIPPSLKELTLLHCVVSPDPQVFARFSGLHLVDVSRCSAPDGMRVTALDVPGVHVFAH